MRAKETPTDPIDNMIVGECREWAQEKLANLRRYVDITRKVRAKWNTYPDSESTYIDLFCNAGRMVDLQTGEYTDGSPLVAWKEARRSETSFSRVLINDIEPTYVSAAEARLRRDGANVVTSIRTAANAAQWVVDTVNPNGYHLAFLDPFNLGVSFHTIATLLKIQRIDILLHISSFDLARNLPQANCEPHRSKMEQFAPDWEKHVDARLRPERMREMYLNYWVHLVEEKTGRRVSPRWRLVRGPNNAPLYWIALIAGHELAHKFWTEIDKSEQQRSFGFY